MDQLKIFIIVIKSVITDKKVVDLFGKTYVVKDDNTIRRIR
jgi:hypothetical protein